MLSKVSLLPPPGDLSSLRDDFDSLSLSISLLDERVTERSYCVLLLSTPLVSV